MVTGTKFSDFADRLDAIMPSLMKEFLKHQPEKFYGIKITMPQFVVLEVIYRRKTLNMSQLAKYLNVTTAAITGIVDRLARERFVFRSSDPSDRRIVNVSLTAKGKKIVTEMVSERKKHISRVFGVLSEKDREDYLRIVTRIKDGIRAV